MEDEVSQNPLSAESQYQAAVQIVSSDSYNNANPRQKQEMLWELISNIPYSALPSINISDFKTASRLINRVFLRKAFNLNDDVRSPRFKAFHTYGTIAKVRFVADGNHPFSGIFSSGGVGFMRASLAVGMPKYSPAIAFKFLLDGKHPSENLLLHQALDVQASRDFFERGQTNQTLEPKGFPNGLIYKILKLWLSPISRPINIQLLNHLAEIESNGSAVQRTVTPRLIHLYGADEVRNDPSSKYDFRLILSKIASGSLLYRMYGKTEEDDRQIYIGSIISESGFVATEFGDRILAFKHAWGSNNNFSVAK